MLRRLFALIVLLGLVVGGLYYWKARGGGPFALPGAGEPIGALKDAKVALSVKTALGLARSLRPYAIEVAAEDGVVTLRGTLPRPELRAQAERTAEAVPGVRQVVSHLKVDSGAASRGDAERTLGESLDDRALEVQARLAFSLNRDLAGMDLEVRAYRRTLTLTGEVATPAQKARAVEVARETPNVGEVVDQIRLRGAAASAGRAAAVARALAANPNLAPYKLAVREAEGRLVLTGWVKTGAEKDLAGMLAREAAGGAVENDIGIRP